MEYPYIKIGDSFAVPVQFYNTETNEGLEFTSDMRISTRIVNSAGNIIAEPTITYYPNQSTDTGFILIEVPSEITKTWKPCIAKMDIKLEMNGNIRHSSDITFRIIRGITP